MSMLLNFAREEHLAKYVDPALGIDKNIMQFKGWITKVFVRSRYHLKITILDDLTDMKSYPHCLVIVN